jgi:hypothetical protein
MPRKSRHPEREILELANGSLAAASREAVEAHLAECNKCAAVAAVVGALRNETRARARTSSDLTRQQPGGSETTAYGSAIPAPPAGPGSGVGPTTPRPTGHRDLEFKDLLLDANVDRPMLAAGLGGADSHGQASGQDGVVHLGAADLAAFFYDELAGEAAAAAAGHLATCSDCSNAISLYSGSEAAARSVEQRPVPASEMSPENWRLINEWEEDCLVDPRPESETVSREMLERFLEILRDHREEIDRVAAGPALNRALEQGGHQIVPVVVLDSRGAFRGIEAFHRESRPKGLEVLECQAPPDRFNNLPIHALLGAEREYPMVVSGRINGGTAELDYAAMQASLMRPLGYFIVEN